MKILGIIGEAPFGIRTADGTRVLLCHMLTQLSGCAGTDCEVVIHAHTHKPLVHWDDYGRLYLNPGEASGWTYRRPTAAILETQPLSATIIDLPPYTGPAKKERAVDRRSRV
jgi:predicted phosphodiesterase